MTNNAWNFCPFADQAEMHNGNDWYLTFNGEEMNVFVSEGHYGFEASIPLNVLQSLLANHGLKIVKIP